MPGSTITIGTVMNPDVIVAQKSLPILSAVGKMAKNGVGSIVIVDGKKPIGIFTERDLMHQIAHNPKPIGDMCLGEVMTDRIETIGSRSSVDQAYRKMNDGNYRHLLVEDGGKLVGIVSIKDLTRMREKILEKRVEQKTAEIASVRDRLHESLMRIQREMMIAGAFQKKLIMQSFPGPKRIRASHVYEQAESLGGDYFEILKAGRNRLAMLIVDVMGHGITSALMAIVLKMYFTNNHRDFESPGELVTFINKDLSSLIPEAYFAAGFCGFLDTSTLELDYTHFGLPLPGILRAKSRNYEPIPPDAVPIGIYEDTIYPERKLRLDPGDCLLFFTDGCTEQKNPAGQMMGTTHFIHQLKNNCGRGGEEIVKYLYDFVRGYADGLPIADDISILLLEFFEK